MYTLKSIVQRGTTLSAAFAMLVAAVLPAVLPAVSAYADSLNPLTNRSLTLSSSSPGWSFTDGSGNTKYAPPNSGANGKQSGNTFEFNTTTDSSGSNDPIKGMTFQYCTQPAGQCRAPGDDVTHGLDTTTTADTKVVSTVTPAEVGTGDFSTVVNTTGANAGIVKAVPGMTNPDVPADVSGQFAAKNVAGNFTVYYDDAGTWTPSLGWTMTASNQEEAPVNLGDYKLDPTGQNNYIKLVNSTGQDTPAGAHYKIVFFGTTGNYIQNPGSGAFFVKINTYNDDATLDAAHVIDGGVTVANVMNQSIQITTKVLETMQFSVGTVDPNTLSSLDGDATPGSEAPSSYEKAMGVGTDGTTTHSPCDPIATSLIKSDTVNHPANVLRLGNQTAESALEVAHTYSTHSYWRLSSNSSAGATVYYSGHTLSNTVGDQIAPINSASPGVKAHPQRGAEQFGLAIAAGASSPYATSYAQEATYENAEDNGALGNAIHSSTTTQVAGNASWHAPQLFPLVPATNYNEGQGAIDGSSATSFAFDPQSDTVPVALATENAQVVDCVTAKMRYIANIAATTPAGIYTTKVNYIAAPQY